MGVNSVVISNVLTDVVDIGNRVCVGNDQKIKPACALSHLLPIVGSVNDNTRTQRGL